MLFLGYLEKNRFLPDLNNEKQAKNLSYKKNLASLDKLILIRFEQDVMIKPGHTAVKFQKESKKKKGI